MCIRDSLISHGEYRECVDPDRIKRVRLMLKGLFEILATEYSGLNVFRYLTFRAICGILTALVMSFVIGPLLIRKLNDLRIGETIREDGPTSHQHKSGTPTMGGALILVATVIATLLWSDLSNRFVWITLFACVGFGLIGWIDDLSLIHI